METRLCATFNGNKQQPASVLPPQRVTAKMRLYLAVAVLMLAFVAYTEAQEEETVEQRFTRLGQHMSEMSRNLAEKAKTTLEEFQTSDAYVTSKNWVQEQLEKVKAKFLEISQ